VTALAVRWTHTNSSSSRAKALTPMKKSVPSNPICVNRCLFRWGRGEGTTDALRFTDGHRWRKGWPGRVVVTSTSPPENVGVTALAVRWTHTNSSSSRAKALTPMKKSVPSESICVNRCLFRWGRGEETTDALRFTDGHRWAQMGTDGHRWREESGADIPVCQFCFRRGDKVGGKQADRNVCPTLRDP